MKVEQANRGLNVAGGVITGTLGVIGWGVGIWAALHPYPAQPSVASLPTPDAAVCRAHAQDLGFAPPVPPAPVAAKGAGQSEANAPKSGEKPAAVKAGEAKLPAAYKVPQGAWEFTAQDKGDPEGQLNAASALITRCAAELEYFCMGEGCRTSDGEFLRVVLSPSVAVAAPSTVPGKAVQPAKK